MVLYEAAGIVISLYFILKGSEWVTDAVSIFAHRFKTTQIAIGLLLVSFILSLPELLIAVTGVLYGHPAISLGVSIGSVIVNLALVTGLAAMIHPLKVPRHVFTRDGVFMLVATIIVATILLSDFKVSKRDGFILLLLFLPYIVNVYAQEKQLAKKEQEKEVQNIAKSLELTGKVGLGSLQIHSGWIILFAGSLMLLGGSQLFTVSLISLAGIFNIPDLLMGLTLGAVGPSIPNIAAAIQAARHKYDELVISEAIGSNVFTLLVTVGIIALLQPISIDGATAMITVPALLAVTAIFSYFLLKGNFSRRTGAALVACYLATLMLEYAYR